jgi:hypothetical protein
MGFNIEQEVLASRWMSKDDVSAHGEVVTIAGVTREEVGQDNEVKFALHFAQFDKQRKPLLLNKVNSRVLVGLFGPDTDGWKGRMAVLVNDLSVTFQGATGAVRVRPYVQAQPAAPTPHTLPPQHPMAAPAPQPVTAAAPFSDDIPF